MTHVWVQTMGRFRPSFASDEIIVTSLPREGFIEQIIVDHTTRSKYARSSQEYRVEDFTDEFKVYVLRRRGFTAGKTWDLLGNFQYEGYS